MSSIMRCCDSVVFSADLPAARLEMLRLQGVMLRLMPVSQALVDARRMLFAHILSRLHHLCEAAVAVSGLNVQR